MPGLSKGQRDTAKAAADNICRELERRSAGTYTFAWTNRNKSLVFCRRADFGVRYHMLDDAMSAHWSTVRICKEVEAALRSDDDKPSNVIPLRRKQ